MSYTSALTIKRLRTILKFGSAVFGLSALFLLIDPKTFLELLNLESTESLQWSMRMIAINVACPDWKHALGVKIW